MRGEAFRTLQKGHSGPPSFLYFVYWVSSRGKGPGEGFDHPTSSSPEVKEHPLLAFMVCSRVGFTHFVLSVQNKAKMSLQTNSDIYHKNSENITPCFMKIFGAFREFLCLRA